jgi:hypothetical protein
VILGVIIQFRVIVYSNYDIAEEINNYLYFLFSFSPEKLEEDRWRLALSLTISKSFLFLLQNSEVEKTESTEVLCIRALLVAAFFELLLFMITF